ncbi:MAG: polymorphic toxin-type HINT domain-containing protein, partial [Planctomycetota bacterium]|nr:polymorphic toxin-type HINT domain-containing protein [Planctomycetota bacterium]
SESAIANPYLFLSRCLDSTGNYYFRERYYDPVRGRFLERDSKNDELNLGNLYTFASNNPLTYTDPWGMSGQAGGNGFYKQAGKLGLAFLKGIGKGVWNNLTGMFSMPNLPSWSSIKSLISQLWNDPSGMFKKMFKDLRAKSAEEWAEMAGEMFVDLVISLLAGGAGLGKIAAKLGKKAMGLLVKGLSKINRAAKRAGIRVKIGGKCIYNACFVAGTLVLLGNGDFKAIKKVQVGDRVQTKQFDQKPEPEPEIDQDWVVVSVRIPSKSGNAEEDGECTLLRSRAWFDKHYSKEKKAVWLQFGETQTIGWYPVLSTKEASKPKTGNGRLVLSTINRVVCNVYELKIVGLSETIKGTGNHKFWSEDRQDWVPLCALKLGERLLLKSAVKAHVEWVKRVAGKFRVYNFEVQGIHNYYVGLIEALAHNNNDDCVTFMRATRKSKSIRPAGSVSQLDGKSGEEINRMARQHMKGTLPGPTGDNSSSPFLSGTENLKDLKDQGDWETMNALYSSPDLLVAKVPRKHVIQAKDVFEDASELSRLEKEVLYHGPNLLSHPHNWHPNPYYDKDYKPLGLGGFGQ